MTTGALWQATHRALATQQWSAARALLEELSRRSDNHQTLDSAESYGLTGPRQQLIQDRIDLVNSKADP